MIQGGRSFQLVIAVRKQDVFVNRYITGTSIHGPHNSFNGNADTATDAFR